MKMHAYFCDIIRKRLVTGTIPVNNSVLTGTFPVNNSSLAVTVFFSKKGERAGTVGHIIGEKNILFMGGVNWVPLCIKNRNLGSKSRKGEFSPFNNGPKGGNWKKWKSAWNYPFHSYFLKNKHTFFSQTFHSLPEYIFWFLIFLIFDP
jgi:hypothetical protein